MSILNHQQLINRLKAQMFIFEEEQVEIVLLSDIEPFENFGLTFSGGKKSTTLSVPRYYASWLFTNGKARFTQPDLYSQLINSFKEQARGFKLQEMKENLLVEALATLENYNTNPALKEFLSEQERNRIQETLYNLSNERLKRILRDLTLNDYKKVERSLDDLEKPVLKEIFNILQIYLELLAIKAK